MQVGKNLISMYITLMPVIVAGVLNMKILKTSFMKRWELPLDGGRKWIDGRPLFGENKTWRGAFLMVLCSSIAMMGWGALCRWVPFLESHNHFYYFHENTWAFNAWIGCLLGAAYIVFELPNSFWKRRRSIAPGQASTSAHPLRYLWLDQMDSLFGCALVVAAYYPMGFGLYFEYVMVGAATHLAINAVLVSIGWKKSI